MSDRRRPRDTLALISCATAVGAVAALASILAANRGDEPSAFIVPAAVAFLAPMIAGCAVALVGVVRRSPPLLLIAGTMLGEMSVVAFSGVTLILLVPSVLLFYVATKDSQPRRPPSIGRWLMVILGAVLTAPVVVLVVTHLGVVGLVGGLVLALAIATVHQLATQRGAARTNKRKTLALVAVAAGLLSGSIVLFGRTEQRCWARTETPRGPVESIGPASAIGEVVITGPAEGGCGPVTTPDGLALGLLLLASAVGLAALVPVEAPPRPGSASL